MHSHDFLGQYPKNPAVLIVVGIENINMDSIRDVSRSKRIIMVVTFLATLTLPIQQAVIIGVVLSLLEYVYSSSQHVGDCKQW